MVGIITAVITALIALLAFIISFVSFWNTSKKEAGKSNAVNAEVLTKLEFIGNDLKDIKAEYKATNSELNKVRETADYAAERAEEAHRRLNRAGIDVYES